MSKQLRVLSLTAACALWAYSMSVADMEKFEFKQFGPYQTVQICDELPFEVIENELPLVDHYQDENYCAKVYTIKDKGDNYIFGFGAIIYKVGIDKSDYSNFRKFYFDEIVKNNNPALSTKIDIADVTEIKDESFSTERISYLEKSDPSVKNYLIYEMAIKNSGGRSLMVFTIMPNSMSPEFINQTQKPESIADWTDMREDMFTWYRATKQLLAGQ